MNVEDVYRRSVLSCTPGTTIAEAGGLLQEGEVHALPVVSDAGKVIGVVSERDLFQLLVLSGRPATAVPIRAAVSPILHSCRKMDGVRDALRTMRTQGVRLLPVVDGAGVLEGMLSFDDLVLAAKTEETAGPTDISDEDIVLAMKMIRRAGSKPELRAPEKEPVIWI